MVLDLGIPKDFAQAMRDAVAQQSTVRVYERDEPEPDYHITKLWGGYVITRGPYTDSAHVVGSTCATYREAEATIEAYRASHAYSWRETGVSF